MSVFCRHTAPRIYMLTYIVSSVCEVCIYVCSVVWNSKVCGARHQHILHYTSPHYMTPHHTTPHHTALHPTTLHYTTLHCTTSHYTAIHYTTLQYTILYYTTQSVDEDVELMRSAIPMLLARCVCVDVWVCVCVINDFHGHITPHFTNPHYTTLHYTILYYTTLYYTSLNYILLHYTSPHYTALHCTTLHHADATKSLFSFACLPYTCWSLQQAPHSLCSPSSRDTFTHTHTHCLSL
jgi:hypothetical protein